MATFIREDSEQVTSKFVEVPKELVNKAKVVYNTIGKKYPTAQGSKRIKKIATSDEKETYNQKKGEGDVVHDDGKIFMRGSAIKRADHDLRHLPNDPNSLGLAANGGFDFKKFYNDTLKRLRTSIKQNPMVKQVMPQKQPTKVSQVSPTTAVKPNDVSVTEEKKIIIVNEEQVKNCLINYLLQK